MTIAEWHRQLISQLRSIYSEGEAKSIARIVIEDVFSVSSGQFVLRANETVIKPDEEKLTRVLSRLLQHEPVQYVLGVADFYGLKFKVNRHVLIPRQETEELVQWVLIDLKEKFSDRVVRVLDIGTGSGCIAIALGKKLPAKDMVAIDNSGEALKIATENAKMN